MRGILFSLLFFCQVSFGAFVIPNGAVTTSKLATNAVTTVKITDANVTTAKIADSNVTTAKIADSNVTTAKILDANVTTAKIADSNVTTAKIADSNVTTAKIADSNVTNGKIATATIGVEKLATANYAESSASGSFTGGSGARAGVTGMTATLTTHGRPVRVQWLNDGSNGYVGGTGTNSGVQVYFGTNRDATPLDTNQVGGNIPSGTLSSFVPCSAISTVDIVGAGTYTYTGTYQVISTGTTANVQSCKLFVWEE